MTTAYTVPKGFISANSPSEATHVYTPSKGVCRLPCAYPREMGIQWLVMEGSNPPGPARRIFMDRWTEAELAIYNAAQAVERAGCHPLLTDAVILLGEARSKVADYVDLPKDEPPKDPE